MSDRGGGQRLGRYWRVSRSPTVGILALTLCAILVPAIVARGRHPAPARVTTRAVYTAFSASFDGTSLDTSTWATCYPWFSNPSAGCTNFGNPSEEEWYLPSQDQVSNGALHMVEEAVPTQGTDPSGAAKTYPYRSGMVTTYPSFSFTYGYVQVVARIPGGAGTWPALWLLPQSQSWPPEIDIMENWGSPNTIQTTFHWGSPDDPQQATHQVVSGSDLTAGWHTYGLLWQPGSLTWYLDGTNVFSYTGSSVPSVPMYVLANLAIDGPAVSGSSFDVRSVKVYR